MDISKVTFVFEDQNKDLVSSSIEFYNEVFYIDFPKVKKYIKTFCLL